MKSPARNDNARGSGLGSWGYSLKHDGRAGKAQDLRQLPPASSPEPRARHKEQGFSLIELLMASLVVASAGAILIGSMTASNRSAQMRAEGLIAKQLLASRLALLKDQLSDQTPTSGAFDAPFEDSSWTMESSEAPMEPLEEVTLSVNHEGHAIDVVTYRPIAQK